MAEDFSSLSSGTNGGKKEMREKIVISKLAAVVLTVVILLIILAVGLLVGLVGRPTATENNVSDQTTTTKPGVVTPTSQPTGPWSDTRLPTTLVPHHYMVDLQPNLTPDASGMYWFNGTSEAFFNVSESTDYIYIHANKLDFTTVDVRDGNGGQVGRKDWWWHEENEFLIIPLDSPMAVGMNYSLYTEFKGELSDDLGGLYRSVYTNADGGQTVIAATQFSPTDARKAFPCFDEPALKATFDIYLSHQDPYYALSNMPNISTEILSNAWKRTKFERTPIMSSYILAFIICDFDYIESATTSGIQTRIYARKAQVEKGNADYAKRITPTILSRYEDYFSVPYPLPKSDFRISANLQHFVLLSFAFDDIILIPFGSGEVSYDITLGLTEFLRQDFDYISWKSALDMLGYLDIVLGRSKAYGVYSAYMAYIVQPLYNNLTWTDDGDDLEQYQRINAIGAACSYGVPGCVENATAQFSEWMGDPSNNTISVNLRSTIYCHAIANGGAKEWDFAWDQYLKESNSQEKAKLQYGLTCTRTPWIITRLLDLLLNDTFVRKQDAPRTIPYLCGNEYARDLTWDWVRTKWDFLYDIYGTTLFSLRRIITGCTSHFSTEFELTELESFKQTNQDKLGSGATATEQAIELTKTNINWRFDYEDIVYEWFKNKVPIV